jgi:hypothetical protein
MVASIESRTMPQLRRLVAGFSPQGLSFSSRTVLVGFVEDKIALG